MGQTLAERIQYEAAYDRNLIFKAYAGDLADLMSELTTRAERAEAEVEALKIELNALSNHILDSDIWGPADAALAAVPYLEIRTVAEAVAQLTNQTDDSADTVLDWLDALERPSNNDLLSPGENDEQHN